MDSEPFLRPEENAQRETAETKKKVDDVVAPQRMRRIDELEMARLERGDTFLLSMYQLHKSGTRMLRCDYDFIVSAEFTKCPTCYMVGDEHLYGGRQFTCYFYRRILDDGTIGNEIDSICITKSGKIVMDLYFMCEDGARKWRIRDLKSATENSSLVFAPDVKFEQDVEFDVRWIPLKTSAASEKKNEVWSCVVS